jgi:hypothetical protein
MFNPRQFLRMAKWAKNPPSETRVKLVFGAILICLVIAGIEYFVGWPDWMSIEPGQNKIRF